MSFAQLRLIRPTAADIPFIMATERTPGYEPVLGRSDAGWHRAALADPGIAYFIGLLGSEPIGFAIVRGWAAPERVAHIKRFAAVLPGQGYGRPLIRAVVDAAFEETSVYRLSLGLFPENARARRLYEGAGFKPEGIARGSAFFGGAYRDELIMAIVRPDWAEAGQPAP